MGKLWWPVAVAMPVLLGSVHVFAAQPAHGQQPPASKAPLQSPAQPRTPPSAQAVPAGSQDDLRSIDSIIAALYQAISGPAGQRRNWERFRSLFVPGARLIAIGHSPAGEPGARQFTVEEYITRATPFFDREGFYEREIARHVDTFNHLNQVFSTYESHRAPGDKAFERGINSIQLFNDGQRWWVVNIFWEAEAPSHPIPEEYLPHAHGE